MSTILIVLAADIVLALLFFVVRAVLNEHRQQRDQHERAAAYFANQDQRHARIEAHSREKILSGIDLRAP